MNVLFVGGTGIISSACARLALKRGMTVTLLNRGKSLRHPPPPGVQLLVGDIRDPASARTAIGERSFDAVVQWTGFVPAHAAFDVALFGGRTSQYVFISSASVYHKPPRSLPITESTPLHNPYWQYSRDKIACEEVLREAYRRDGFPVTIVRPSHTYDAGLLPVHGGWTTIDRMRCGLPVIVHGDGTSLWTLTHNDDFAHGLVGLLGQDAAVGEAFHITSDEVLTWNAIHEILGRAAGVRPKLVHVPSELIAAFDPAWGAGLLGDKAHSMIFDNTKLRRLVPDFRPAVRYSRGAEQQIAWYEAEASRRVVDEALSERMDRIIASYEGAWPSPRGAS
ncbi:MAG: SDR family oxidoreductase [Myxococcota bacterium]|nr:SDR family oxidoreductase [Myxococcota bacterium]